MATLVGRMLQHLLRSRLARLAARHFRRRVALLIDTCETGRNLNLVLLKVYVVVEPRNQGIMVDQCFSVVLRDVGVSLVTLRGNVACSSRQLYYWLPLRSLD